MTSILIQAQSPATLITSLFTAAFCFWCFTCLWFQSAKVPLTGTRIPWEPRISANFRFFWDAKSVIDKGYHRFRQRAFKFMRTDGDVIVLPPSFLDELHSLPKTVANPTDGNMHNLLGNYTGLNILLHTDLHFRVIRGRLTPNLTPTMLAIQDELCYSMRIDYPECRNQWSPIGVYDTILHTVARTSARSFVGAAFCRDVRWLEIVTQFTENLFRVVVLTRLFPKWCHAPVVKMLPFYWKGRAYVEDAKKFLAPTIQERLDSVQRETFKDDYPDEQHIMLSYMALEARGVEKDPQWLAHMQVVLSLASIHTVQMSIVHILYDLVSHPKYIDMLRDEVISVYREDHYHWDRKSYNKLEKLDSLMRESQRLSPPSYLAFHRIMEQDFTLSDDTFLPKGGHICMATQAIQNDPNVTPNPEEFDPLRYWKLRQQPDEHHKHQFPNADRTALNFGFGKNACPGRFFASLEIKAIVTKLLMEFDMKSLPGKGRPRNSTVHEFIVPDMKSQILLKRRRETQSHDEPF